MEASYKSWLIQIYKFKKEVFGVVFPIFGELAGVLDLKNSNPPQLRRADVSENARKRAPLLNVPCHAIIAQRLTDHVCDPGTVLGSRLAKGNETELPALTSMHSSSMSSPLFT